ncbi:hypothetical protein [Methylobacterium oryzisoli]|uniref:hypothetical protein n=1 Tax=Methylobacterium oryzisoli TaxID=3385502 RepID=UPI0038915ED2
MTAQIGNNLWDGTTAPYTLQNGSCTNGVNGAGAFSGAALASQSLSDLSQSATTETNRTTSNAIANRRAEETQRSADADRQRQRDADSRNEQARERRRADRPQDTRRQESRRQDARTERAAERRRESDRRDEASRTRRSEARAQAARTRQEEARRDAERTRRADAAEERREAAAASRRAQARRDAERRAQAEERRDEVAARRMRARPDYDARDYDAPPPAGPGPRPIVRKGYDVEPVPVFVPPPQGPRFGVFATGYGDFEQRSGRTAGSIQYDPGGAPQNFPFTVLQRSTTRTGGFLGGIDLTVRDLAEPGDGAIFGLITGYTDTSITISTRTLSPNPALLPNGAASTRVSLTGPSVGAFATYFNGGFSFDQTLKADFYGLDQTFTEAAGFAGIVTAVANLAGSGRTGVTQLSAFGNANYRFFASDTVWFEPTVGYQVTHSFYEASAAQLGLRDGNLIRVQGGARFGFETFLGSTRLTTILTGLAYENVVIDGGFIQAGAFGSNVLALNDEGKLRGQGILTFALDHGNGLSSFVQGDVRGGDRYFAAGGRAGFRYQW